MAKTVTLSEYLTLPARRMFKYAYDNWGCLVITDGSRYIGFIAALHNISDFKDLDRIEFNSYSPFTEHAIKKLEIDKITDWKELSCLN